jgi:hypothetical protein
MKRVIFLEHKEVVATCEKIWFQYENINCAKLFSNYIIVNENIQFLFFLFIVIGSKSLGQLQQFVITVPWDAFVTTHPSSSPNNHLRSSSSIHQMFGCLNPCIVVMCYFISRIILGETFGGLHASD